MQTPVKVTYRLSGPILAVLLVLGNTVLDDGSEMIESATGASGYRSEELADKPEYDYHRMHGKQRIRRQYFGDDNDHGERTFSRNLEL